MVTEKEEFDKIKQAHEITVQCNYSESYKNIEQDEIQIAYIGNTDLSIFTAIVYCKADWRPTKYLITITTELSVFSGIAALCLSQFSNKNF